MLSLEKRLIIAEGENRDALAIREASPSCQGKLGFSSKQLFLVMLGKELCCSCPGDASYWSSAPEC